MKKFLKFAGIFIILIIAFNLLLFLGSLFSSDLIEKNVKETSQILLEEGNQYQFFEFYDISNNNYTDSIMINEAYSIDNKNPIRSYMSVRKNYKEGITQKQLTDNLGESISMNTVIYKDSFYLYDPVGELEEFLEGNIDTSMTYARYWHGYLPILRVMLLLFNIAEIRIIILLIFAILFGYLLYLLKKKLGIRITIIYGMILVIFDYFFVSYSLESSPVFIVMMLACIILLKWFEYIKKNWYVFIFIIACITNFVDYLTVPLITLAMPLYIYLVYNQKNTTEPIWKESLKLVINSSIVWFLGYVFTWLSKWIIYDIIYQEGLIKSAIEQCIYRATRSNIFCQDNVWQTMWTMILDKIVYIIILVVTILIFLIKSYKTEVIFKNKKNYLIENIPLLVISLMPIVWYAVLANHTILHTHFVYRHLSIFFIGILLSLSNFIIIQEKEVDEVKK